MDIGPPTEEEKQKILQYLQAEFKLRKKQFRFFGVLIGILTGLTTFGVIFQFFRKDGDTATLITGVCLAGILWFFSTSLEKSCLNREAFENHVRRGHYQVLDCMSYPHSYNQDNTRTEGSVRIQTKDHIALSINFVIDIETALRCEKEENLPMLLLYDKETDTSRVFSEKMLGGYRL